MKSFKRELSQTIEKQNTDNSVGNASSVMADQSQLLKINLKVKNGRKDCSKA